MDSVLLGSVVMLDSALLLHLDWTAQLYNSTVLNWTLYNMYYTLGDWIGEIRD